jgi:hypothetical protein
VNEFDEVLKKHNDNNTKNYQKLDQNAGDEKLRKAIFYAKAIYQPKNNQYFVNNSEIEFVAQQCYEKYGFEAIEKLFNSVKEQRLLGLLRKKWTVNSMEDDLLKLNGELEKEVKKPFEISEKEQFNRYIHLVYAENEINVMALDTRPNKLLTNISNMAYLKYKLSDIEALIDYFNSRSEFRHSRYGKKITFLDLEKDIHEAVSDMGNK